ncbi:acetyl-CoA synthetase-like protein [Aspergillus crustosus]
MSESPFPRDDIHPVFQASNARLDRLVHLIPDELAKEVPDHPLFAYPRTADPQDGFVDIPCKDFANAVNRVGWYLISLLGRPLDFPTIGYMGPNDIRYFLLMFGAIKVGYKMLFLSPRNTLEGNLHVLEGASCHVFLRANETNIDGILKSRPMLSWVIPQLDDLLLDTPVAVYPYEKSFEEAWADPCLVLHTTGSTGLPKPITWKVGILSTYEAWRTIPNIDGYVPTTEIYQQSRRAYTSMPLFHTSGLNAGITWAMLLGVTLVYGAPHVVPNATYADRMHRYAGVDSSMGAPSIYEELCRDLEALKRISRLNYVVASGAPLSHQAGDLISKHTRVICNLGATETACLQRLSPSIDDWPYFYWHPTHSGIEMRETADGFYELFIVRDSKLSLFQGVFNTFPDLSTWSMRDLYSRHPDPSKPFLYMFQCRKDDVIVLSNGEKVAPALIEATLMSHPLVKGAMVVGQGRLQPAALLDLACDAPCSVSEKERLLQSLAFTIARANEHAPGHGRLDRYHILFADPLKPISYLGQGKIQRKNTLQLYKEEVNEVYRKATSAAEGFGLPGLPPLKLDITSDVASWLQRLVNLVTNLGLRQTSDDLFLAGVDSLQVIQICRELRFQARLLGMGDKSANMFPPASIYTHPTVDHLARHVLDQFYLSKLDTNSRVSAVSSLEEMGRLFQKYCDSLPRSRELYHLLPSENKTVLLTGSTGSLGGYLLNQLQQDSSVSRIVCMDRSANAAARHVRAGFAVNSSRVEFLQANITQPNFGLPDRTYIRLLATADNQWPVNFNWTISSFEPFICGVRNIILFSHASQLYAFIMFISSISAVGSWSTDKPVPEEPIHDFAVAAQTGYGQSKLLSECLLNRATEVSGVGAACCRVGIIAGPVTCAGQWNPNEYIPSIFISSVQLKAFPVTFPSRDRVDWIPVDKLAEILVNILHHSSEPSSPSQPSAARFYNIVNPDWISWAQFAPEALQCFPHDLGIRPVPFESWVEILEQSMHMDTDTAIAIRNEASPANKMLNFFQNAVSERSRSRILSSARAQEASPLLREVGCVNVLWLRGWMQQWKIPVCLRERRK